VTAERKFLWDWREQPPMTDIAAAVTELTGGTVSMTMPDTGSDSYELVITRTDGGGRHPDDCRCQFCREDIREAQAQDDDDSARDALDAQSLHDSPGADLADDVCPDCGMRHNFAEPGQ
jgi:hypothetical protein